jgi:hypothetical protein
MEREEAIRALTEAGVHDWTIARTTIWGLPGRSEPAHLWVIGRWGPDEASSVHLGEGQTLAAAIHAWRRTLVTKGRRGT